VPLNLILEKYRAGSTLYADCGPPFGLAWILSQPAPAIRALCTGPYTGPGLIFDGQRAMSVRRAVLYFRAPGCSRGFFTVIGDEVASKIVFVCSDMWKPHLKVNLVRGICGSLIRPEATGNSGRALQGRPQISAHHAAKRLHAVGVGVRIRCGP
jgi:hypothetical protein